MIQMPGMSELSRSPSSESNHDLRYPLRNFQNYPLSIKSPFGWWVIQILLSATSLMLLTGSVLGAGFLGSPTPVPSESKQDMNLGMHLQLEDGTTFLPPPNGHFYQSPYMEHVIFKLNSLEAKYLACETAHNASLRAPVVPLSMFFSAYLAVDRNNWQYVADTAPTPKERSFAQTNVRIDGVALVLFGSLALYGLYKWS